MRALLLGGCALVASACMQNPDEILPIHGSLTTPLSSQSVLLRRRIQPRGEAGGCNPEGAPVIKETRTDADGGFRFQVFRAEGQSFGVGQLCFRVETTFPSGSRAWSDLNSLLLDNPVAPMPEWNTAPQLDAGLLVFEPVIPFPADYVIVDYAARRDEPQLEHDVLVDDPTGIVWRMTDTFTEVVDGGIAFRRRPLRLDATLLEDFAATVKLRARLTDFSLRQQYAFYDLSLPAVDLQPASDPVVRGALVPVTRGVPCAPFGSPCPFTDGSLERVDAGMATDLTLDLPTPTEVHLLVLRDVSMVGTALDLEFTFEDGGVWSVRDDDRTHSFYDPDDVYRFFTLPDGGFSIVRGSYRTVALDAGAPIRRATLKFPLGLDALREVSLF